MHAIIGTHTYTPATFEGTELPPPGGEVGFGEAAEEGEGLGMSGEVEGLGMSGEVEGSGWASARIQIEKMACVQHTELLELNHTYSLCIMAFSIMFKAKRTMPLASCLTLNYLYMP